MRSLILNSGLGSRMGDITLNKHKSMVEISDGLPLIIYQIEAIASRGITDFVITTGHMEDKLKDLIYKRFGSKYNFKFVYNPDYKNTNYIFSMFLALDELHDDLIMLHGDLYFTEEILSQLLSAEKSSVVIDTTIPLPVKDFKARIQNNRVKQIATYIDDADCFACQPLYKLNKEDWFEWSNAIWEFCDAGKTDVYAEEALNTVLNLIDLSPLDIKGELCMEVDTPEDLELLRSRKEGARNE